MNVVLSRILIWDELCANPAVLQEESFAAEELFVVLAVISG